MLREIGEQQLLDHIKRQQRLHAVKRKGFPELRASEPGEAARLPEDVADRRGHCTLPGRGGSSWVARLGSGTVRRAVTGIGAD